MTDRLPSMLVYFWNGIGDLWLSVPTLRSLNELSGGRITLLMPRHLHEALPLDLQALPCLHLPGGMDRRKAPPRSVIQSMLGQVSAGTFVCLVPYWSPFLETLKEEVAAPVSIGVAGSRCDQTVGRVGQHYADLIFEVASALGEKRSIERFASRPFLMAEQNERRAARIRSAFDGHRLLIVHTVSSERRKCLSATAATEIVSRFLEEHADFMALIVDPIDTGLAARLGGDRAFCVPYYSVATVAAVIARADFFLGIDSCFLHASDLLRVPSVGIFGPTEPSNWGFRFSDGSALSAPSVDEITPRNVVEMMRRRLASSPSKQQIALSIS